MHGQYYRIQHEDASAGTPKTPVASQGLERAPDYEGFPVASPAQPPFCVTTILTWSPSINR